MSKRTNGEGTIYQRDSGLWCAELTIGYDANGKRIKKSFSSMDLEKLQKKLNDEKFNLNRNIITQKSNYTVSEWVQFWLDNYKKITLKSTTYDRYEYTLKIYIKPFIGHYKLDKIRPEMLQQLYNKMYRDGLSTSSIKKVHLTLNQAFEQAIKNDLLYKNPCKAATVPKTGKKDISAMTEEEQKAFTENCPNTKYGNFFIFALNTGMRSGEIMALTWSDINFEDMTITVNKTASTIINRDESADTKTKTIITDTKTEKGKRIIPLSKAADNILKEQMKKETIFVFSSNKDGVINKRNLRQHFNNILVKADISERFTIHSLRHTFATRLIEKGANPKTVSEIMGHSSIQITFDIYGHVMPNQKKEVISLLD